MPGHTTSDTVGGDTGSRAIGVSTVAEPVVSVTVARTTRTTPALATVGAAMFSVDPITGKVLPGTDGPETSDQLMVPVGGRFVFALKLIAWPAAAVDANGPRG